MWYSEETVDSKQKNSGSLETAKGSLTSQEGAKLGVSIIIQNESNCI